MNGQPCAAVQGDQGVQGADRTGQVGAASWLMKETHHWA